MTPAEPRTDVVTEGLADIHCHGAVGHEFGVSAAGTRAAVAHHRERGTSWVIASLVSGTDAALESQVATLAALVADGTIAGIHLEGPYLSPGRRGAHDLRVLRDPDPGFVDRLADLAAAHGAPNALRHMTFAPERLGAQALVRALARRGIRPAVGHTEAPAALVRRTLGEISDTTGAPALVTHLFNGMPPFHHRSGGPAAAALGAAARGEAYVELIADGVHVSADVVRMVFETVGADRIVLISDAMSATGLGDGDHWLGGLAVEVRDGTARLASADDNPGPIAGSTSTLADVVRWAIEIAGIEAADVIHSATSTPLQALGLADDPRRREARSETERGSHG